MSYSDSIYSDNNNIYYVISSLSRTIKKARSSSPDIARKVDNILVDMISEAVGLTNELDVSNFINDKVVLIEKQMER